MKDLVCEEHVTEIRKRDEFISELEREIQKRKTLLKNYKENVLCYEED